MLTRISFVCQRGRLEPQGILLAASIRLHFPVGLKLIAAHPYEHGPLARETLNALDDLGVKVVGIKNPLDASYPIGHKLAALALLDGPGLGLFLDSDILVMGPPEELSEGLAAVPANAQHCDFPAWQHIYEYFGLDFPKDSPATLLSQETTAPYYNTGFIAIPGEMAPRFAAAWTDCARQIDTDLAVPELAKRPYLDQTAFPVAAALLGHSIEALGEKWNFRGWAWHIPAGSCPIFFHYQDIVRLSRQASSLTAARAAKSLSPAVVEALQGVI